MIRSSKQPHSREPLVTLTAVEFLIYRTLKEQEIQNSPKRAEWRKTYQKIR